MYCDQRRSLGGVIGLSVGARIAVGELGAGQGGAGALCELIP